MNRISLNIICLSFLAIPTSLVVASENRQVEEVIVTAQKRDENLLSVPIAIDVINGSFISESGALGLSELESAIPSVNFGRGGRKTRGEISIRGVGGFARNIGSDGRVVVYVDDVPLGRSTAFDASLLDVKQIEILKGPQGTLFGANTIAGAINITTQNPTDELNHEFRSDFGDRAYRLFSVKSNIPFTENLSARIQINHREYDGHIQNINTNQDLQGSDLDATRIKLVYRPTNDLKIRASLDWLEDKAAATNAEALGDTEFLGIPLTGHSSAPSPRDVAHDADEFENRQIWGGSLKTEYALPSGNDIVSITAYRSSEFSEQSEEDYSPIPLSTSIFDENYSQWTQELRYASLINDRFDYVAGVFFLTNKISTERSASLVLGPSTTLSANTPGNLKSTSLAVFGNLNYRFTNQLEITLGSRLQNESKEIKYSISDTTGNFANDDLKDESTYTNFLPKLSLNYKNNNNALLYASIASGAKSGGWNADFVPSLEDITFDAERSISYEIGYKNRILDGSAEILTSLFHTEFTNYQVSQFRQESGANEITNAGETTTQGFEVEFQYFVNENIDFNINSSYLKAEYTKFKDGGGTGIHYDGNILEYAPELTTFIGLNIQHPVSSYSYGYFHLNYSYSDGYYSHPQNNEETDKIDSFFLVSGHMGLNIDEYINISFWVKNLTNETNLRFKGQSFLGVQRGYYEEPRNAGISIKLML
ncbi:MAG: TonB-dependent receptor [Agarilytica sp.]